MDACGIYLVEGGFPVNLPGFGRDIPSASFPFWGSYCFLDFSTINFAALSSDSYTLVAESHFRSLLSFISSREKEELEKLVFLEEGIPAFIELLRNNPVEKILLCPISLVCDLDTEALRTQMENLSVDILKISLNNAAADLYIGRRQALIDTLESYCRRGPADRSLAALFSQALHTSFDAMQSIPGKILFQNSLMQLYTENIWLAAHLGSPEMAERLRRLGNARNAGTDILIDKGAEVRYSLLAPGSRVEGYVEGSFLFPNVVVHKNAVVYNSIIMNSNRIGAKAEVYKALILPYLGDNGKGLSNIGENATIGVKQSSARSFDYPNQIQGGITVLGVNSEIPKGYRIGPGCLVGTGVSPQTLRSMKELKKGDSVLKADVREAE